KNNLEYKLFYFELRHQILPTTPWRTSLSDRSETAGWPAEDDREEKEVQLKHLWFLHPEGWKLSSL
ncbi:hypothetical protein AMECASPLE_025477, partial [Ameca splendens]